MITFEEAIERCGLNYTEIGSLVNLGKSAISLIKARKYQNWENYQKAIITKLGQAGYLGDEYDYESPELFGDGPKVDPQAFISTQNVQAVNALCDDLLDPSTSLNASLGMVVGSAGYGKTTALQHYASVHDSAIYILYMEGYTLVGLCKAIAFELIGTSGRTYLENLALIDRATSTVRKLIIIDEADRMPIRLLEGIRNLNERCGAPMLLAGEETLTAKMETQPRLRSRVRKPEIKFVPINHVDVATFYEEAIGLSIAGDEKVCMQLLRWANRDFRTLVNDAQHICRIMHTHKLDELTSEVLNEYKPYRK